MKFVLKKLNVMGSTRFLMIVVTLAYLMSAGCVAYREMYFIEVEECRPGWDHAHSSFLKLDLYGRTFLTTSKFEMGWYDRRGVDSLFSTMAPTSNNDMRLTASEQPPTGTDEEMGMDCSEAPESKRLWRRTRAYGPNGKAIGDVSGKRLVIFAASNPGDLVNRISTTANTLAMSEQLAGNLRKSEIDEVARVDLKVDLAGRRHESLAGEVLDLLRWLDDSGASKTNDLLKAKLTGLSRHVEATVEAR